MIFDYLSNLIKYKEVIPHLNEVLDYLSNNDLNHLEYGKHIVNDNVFIMRQSYIGKNENEVYPEKHNNYLDIQIVLSGYELCYFDLYNSEFEIYQDFLEERDVVFFKNKINNKVVLCDSKFAVFFKEDVHAPGIKLDNNIIEKLVIKIKY